MKAISKQALLKIIDDNFTDDAMFCASSGIAGDAFEITDDSIFAIIIPAEEQDPADQLPNSTHVLVTL